MATLALPILDAPVLRDAVPRDLCTDCGLEFARARIDMKMGEGILTLRRHHPRRMKRMVPAHAWQLAASYGIRPEPGEQMEDIARGEQ